MLQNRRADLLRTLRTDVLPDKWKEYDYSDEKCVDPPAPCPVDELIKDGSLMSLMYETLTLDGCGMDKKEFKAKGAKGPHASVLRHSFIACYIKNYGH